MIRSHLLACGAAMHHYLSLMFKLTRQEQKLVAFVLAAFLAGLGIKHWRETRATDAAAAQVSAH